MPIWIEIGGWFRRNENGPDTPVDAAEFDELLRRYLIAVSARTDILTREWPTVEDAAAYVARLWSVGQATCPVVLAIDSESGNELADITPTHDGQVRIVWHQHEETV